MFLAVGRSTEKQTMAKGNLSKFTNRLFEEIIYFLSPILFSKRFGFCPTFIWKILMKL